MPWFFGAPENGPAARISPPATTLHDSQISLSPFRGGTYGRESLAQSVGVFHRPATVGARQAEVVKVPRGGAVRRACGRTTGFQARRGAAVDGLGRPSYAGRVTNPSYQRRRGCQRTARVESPRSGVRAASSPIAARRLTAYWEGRAAMGATGPFGERAAARTRHDRVDSHSRAPRSGRPPGPDRAKPHHPGRSIPGLPAQPRTSA